MGANRRTIDPVLSPPATQLHGGRSPSAWRRSLQRAAAKAKFLGRVQRKLPLLDATALSLCSLPLHGRTLSSLINDFARGGQEGNKPPRSRSQSVATESPAFPKRAVGRADRGLIERSAPDSIVLSGSAAKAAALPPQTNRESMQKRAGERARFDSAKIGKRLVAASGRRAIRAPFPERPDFETQVERVAARTLDLLNRGASQSSLDSMKPTPGTRRRERVGKPEGPVTSPLARHWQLSVAGPRVGAALLTELASLRTAAGSGQGGDDKPPEDSRQLNGEDSVPSSRKPPSKPSAAGASEPWVVADSGEIRRRGRRLHGGDAATGTGRQAIDGFETRAGGSRAIDQDGRDGPENRVRGEAPSLGSAPSSLLENYQLVGERPTEHPSDHADRLPGRHFRGTPLDVPGKSWRTDGTQTTLDSQAGQGSLQPGEGKTSPPTDLQVLAEQIGRILDEEARRHGIDV